MNTCVMCTVCVEHSHLGVGDVETVGVESVFELRSVVQLQHVTSAELDVDRLRGRLEEIGRKRHATSSPTCYIQHTNT